MLIQKWSILKWATISHLMLGVAWVNVIIWYVYVCLIISMDHFFLCAQFLTHLDKRITSRESRGRRPRFLFFSTTCWMHFSSRSGKFCLNSRKRHVFIHAQIDISRYFLEWNPVSQSFSWLEGALVFVFFSLSLSLAWQALWGTWITRQLIVFALCYALARLVCLHVCVCVYKPFAHTHNIGAELGTNFQCTVRIDLSNWDR